MSVHLWRDTSPAWRVIVVVTLTAVVSAAAVAVWALTRDDAGLEDPVVSVAADYLVDPMQPIQIDGRNEEAAADKASDTYAAYRAAEGDSALDADDAEPAFVGYELVAWRPGEATGTVDLVPVLSYMDGRITSYTSPSKPLTPEGVVVMTGQTAASVGETYKARSDTEKAAVAAAREVLEAAYPDSEWEIAVRRYWFKYDAEGSYLLLGVSDGEEYLASVGSLASP